MNLLEIFLFVSVIAPISATILLSFRKWGLFESYSIYRPAWLPREICQFCAAFWISALLVLAYSFLFDAKIFYIAVPFGSASIAYFIYTQCVK